MRIRPYSNDWRYMHVHCTSTLVYIISTAFEQGGIPNLTDSPENNACRGQQTRRNSRGKGKRDKKKRKKRKYSVCTVITKLEKVGKLCQTIRHSAGSTIQRAERQLSTRPTANMKKDSTNTSTTRNNQPPLLRGAVHRRPNSIFPIVSARQATRPLRSSGTSVILFLSRALSSHGRLRTPAPVRRCPGRFSVFRMGNWMDLRSVVWHCSP